MFQRGLPQLLGPVVLIVVLAVLAIVLPESIQSDVHLAFVFTAIVVSIHTFAGNSGVISFGNISFVAVGAFAAGLMSIGAQQKQNIFPELFGIIADNELGNVPSLLLAALLGGLFAAVAGVPLMRLDGLSAGIATFALLGITRNVLRNWTKIGPGAKTLPGVPETTGPLQATVGLLIVIALAWAYQQSRFGRRLRATREDPAASQSIGVHTYRERLVAFALSGALGGFAGGLYVHFLGSITTEQVYFDLTFITLAMLVIGGFGSLWGAVIGGLLISGLSALLSSLQNGIELVGTELQIPSGTRTIVLGVLMTLILLLRPAGITKGQEFRWPSRASSVE